MPVARWMRQPVVTIGADTAARDAAELMRARQVRHLLVTDARGRLLGIVTDRDLRQMIFDPAIQERLGELPGVLESLPVRDVMTWGAVTVTPQTDLRAAARMMPERKLGGAASRGRWARGGHPDQARCPAGPERCPAPGGPGGAPGGRLREPTRV
jgi:acetoin utilization protein AcuB